MIFDLASWIPCFYSRIFWFLWEGLRFDSCLGPNGAFLISRKQHLIAYKLDCSFAFLMRVLMNLCNQNFFLRLLVQVSVKDVCKEHAGWPVNNMERSYKFMLRHVQLWKVAFHSTSPRWVHCVYLAAIAAFYAKYVSLLDIIKP